MNKFDHLVFIIQNGFIQYRMGDRMGSHPIADDAPEEVITYIRKIIPHKTFEIL